MYLELLRQCLSQGSLSRALHPEQGSEERGDVSGGLLKQEKKKKRHEEKTFWRVDAILSSSVHSGKLCAVAAGPGCNTMFLCNVLPYLSFLQLFPLEPLYSVKTETEQTKKKEKKKANLTAY